MNRYNLMSIVYGLSVDKQQSSQFPTTHCIQVAHALLHRIPLHAAQDEPDKCIHQGLLCGQIMSTRMIHCPLVPVHARVRQRETPLLVDDGVQTTNDVKHLRLDPRLVPFAVHLRRSEPAVADGELQRRVRGRELLRPPAPALQERGEDGREGGALREPDHAVERAVGIKIRRDEEKGLRQPDVRGWRRCAPPPPVRVEVGHAVARCVAGDVRGRQLHRRGGEVEGRGGAQRLC